MRRAAALCRLPWFGLVIGSLACGGQPDEVEPDPCLEPGPAAICAAGWCLEHGPWPLHSVLAIGDDVWVTGADGLLLHHDGCHFTQVDTGAVSDLRGLWGAADDDVWLAGAGGVLRWNGVDWSAVDGLQGDFEAVWASAPDDVWVTGSEGILRGDGQTWSAVHTRGSAAIWGSSATDVWVGGTFWETGFLHWDGASWTATDTYETTITSLDGTGPDDVWAGTLSIDGFSGKMLHRDGTGWSDVRDRCGQAVDVIARDDVWATCERSGFEDTPGTWHWDGARWSDIETEIGGHAISHRGDDDVWIAGTHVRHWDGQQVLARTPPPISSHLVRGLAPGPDGEMWAVAGNQVLRGDADGWRVEYEQQGAWLEGIWVSDSGQVWAVGDIVVRWTGSVWGTVPVPSQRLLAVWGSGDDDVWASSEAEPYLLHWGGTDWQWVPTEPTLQQVDHIWGSSPSNVFALGWTYRAPTRRVVVRWDGTSWSLDGELGGGLSGSDALWGSGPDDVWAAAADMLYRRQPAGWEAVTGIDLEFYPVKGWSFGPDDVWVSHGRRLISHWDGQSWTTTEPPYVTGYMELAGDRSGDLWAASGDNILHRER